MNLERLLAEASLSSYFAHEEGEAAVASASDPFVTSIVYSFFSNGKATFTLINKPMLLNLGYDGLAWHCIARHGKATFTLLD